MIGDIDGETPRCFYNNGAKGEIKMIKKKALGSEVVSRDVIILHLKTSLQYSVTVLG